MVLTCDIPQLSNEYTYTSNESIIQFTTRTASYSDDDYAYDSFFRPSHPTYRPVRAILVDFTEIAGAERFSFDSGYQDQRLSSYELKRYIVPGTRLKTHWIDIHRDGLRDILLIVIGT